MANSPGRHASDDQHPEASEPLARGVVDEGDQSDSARKPWHTKDDSGDGKRGKGGKNKSSSFLRETAIIVGSVLAVMFVLTTFIGRQYVIPSESMESTLHGCEGCTNDRIVTDKLTYRFGDPQPGDVVVFKVPDSWDEAYASTRSSNVVIHKIQDALSWFGFAPPDENDYVKRVIAVGGQTVECRNAAGVGVTVNGKALHEPYVDMALQRKVGGDQLNSCLGPDFGPVKIPDGQVWVMGDNRMQSSDSRYHMDYLPGSTEARGYSTGGWVPVGNIRGKVRTIIFPFSRMGGVGAINPQQ
ncbi:signal peptidase I [Gordonia sp. TBRC 11910]|uniref:Signal peptidase I n=1 Tax=Gordonia asplenii TaxID=2725283 RepID=A0A848KP83_9ACTN|nr:signal peptidase I [Gordonia asplenii]NMN99726.1 signal peptidase I [Gordonia asplenii]